MSKYEMVIGLETHVELKTKTKAFCACANVYGVEPNTLVCPVCMGLPGALPVFNDQARVLAAKAGLALGCTVQPVSRFDRKNYFYPDLPKAYQITQFYHPLCTGGRVEIEVDGKTKIIGITRIHMEEDAGKLTHQNGVTTLDMNRCGVPLIEIVTEPDIRTAKEAAAYLKKLRAILVAAGVSDCRMNEGSLRCDVNLSLRLPGAPLGVRTEMKNLNSFQSVEKAILAEARRQEALLEAGEPVYQETRRYDQKTGQTYGMRRKEDSADYRYFPEPDLRDVIVTPQEMETWRSQLPVLPDERSRVFQSRYRLTAYAAGQLTAEKWLADYYEQAAQTAVSPVALANLILGEVFAQLTLQNAVHTGDRDASCLPIAPGHLATLSNLMQQGRINSTTGKKILSALFQQDTDPEAYAREHNLFLLTDEQTLSRLAEQIIAQNPQLANAYRKGKTAVLQALVGRGMAQTQGRADPEKLAACLIQFL